METVASILGRRAAVIVLLVTGCAGVVSRTDTRANAIAHAWVDALRADDPTAAYALLAEPVRRATSLEAFRAEWQHAPMERARQLAALETALTTGGDLEEAGRIVVASGPIPIVRDSDGWRLERPLTHAQRAGSPDEALRLFATAIEERSFAGAIGLLTNERREDIGRALGAFASGMKNHANESIAISGERATLIWRDGEHRWRISLRREEGEWRIDDFSPL